MNSYNENLQNTVASTLQTQNLEMKSLRSQYKSSMFSLYYAEGATITANEKLASAELDLTNKKKVQKQAVKNNSISGNELASAIQANQQVGQSASYMGVCAANVQVSANAVTRLSSDIGAIYSILHAADRKTDMYTLTQDLHHLINKTATSAEIASKSAMDASRQTSEVTSSAVLNDSKLTNSLVSSLLKISSADFNTSSQTVAADTTILATASTTEKTAEGAFESAEIDYLTSFSAYESVNTGLNQGLTALSVSADSFFVMFNRIESPFPDDQPSPVKSSPGDKNPVMEPLNIWDPVAEYDIFVVKDSKKSAFSVSEAENLRRKYPEQYVKLLPSVLDTDTEIVPGKPLILAEFINYNDVPYVNVLNKEGTYALYDSDGDLVAPGVNYVVFVLAAYTDEYKWNINNFNDFLSAPSLSFCMTTLLNAVDTSTIQLYELTNPEDDIALLKKVIDNNVDTTSILPEVKGSTHLMLFQATPPGDSALTALYKCMYLPTTDIPGGLITQSAFASFTGTQMQNDKIIFDRTQMLSLLTTQLNAKLTSLQKQPKSTEAKKQAALTQEIANTKAHINQLTVINAKPIGPVATSGDPNFFFNKALAEKISAGNYTVAQQVTVLPDDAPTDWWYAFIGPAITDNFGNLLVSGSSYMPAILSVLNSDDAQTLAQYTINISAYTGAPTLTY